MKQIKTQILLGLFGVLFVACDIEQKDFVAHMSYEYDGEDCTTGSHNFTSQKSNEDLYKKCCQELKDNSLNNYCAEGKRRYLFEYLCANYNLNLKWPVE